MKHTVDSVLEGLTTDLGYDAVGFWQLHQYGTEWLGLRDDELEKFLRTAIRHLLDSGAVPLLAHRHGWWLRQDQLGAEPELITANVLHAWNEAGRPVPRPNEIWFGRTDVLDVE